MTTLREAAQQALEALEGWENHDRWVWPESALEQAKRNTTESLAALRSALAQQDEPRNQCGETCERARLCATCAQALAQQAEPVEPVAWLAPDGSVRETPAAKSFGEWVWEPDDFKPLYTAPPQRLPLTDEEIESCRQKGYAHAGLGAPFDFGKAARAVERAHGIKEN